MFISDYRIRTIAAARVFFLREYDFLVEKVGRVDMFREMMII